MSTISIIILTILVVLNLVTFVLFGVDKQQKKKKGDRVDENLLFFLALFGGSLGAVLGMQVWQSKLHNKNFYLGMPTLLLVHVVLALVILTLIFE